MNLSYNVRKLGSTDLGPIRRAIDIVRRGHHAFVCSGPDGILVLNVADPRKPHVMDSWGWWEEGWLPHRLKIVGDRAYVIGRTMDEPPALRILDISHPTRPREIGCCDGDGTGSWEPFHWHLAIAGNLAFVSCGGRYVWVVDISNPAAPEEVCDILMDARVMGVEVRQDLAYVLAGGLRVITVRDPMDPKQVGFFDATVLPAPRSPLAMPFEEPMCRQLLLDGDRAFVADYMGGYHVIGVADPTRPRKVGWIRTPEEVRDVDLAVNGNHAIVLDIARRGHLRIFDITDPRNPVALGFRDIPHPSHCLSVSEEHVYVAGFTHFGIYDCSAAMKPTL